MIRKQSADKKRETTPERAYEKLAALCSRSEKCEDDARRLMIRWEIAPDKRDEIVEKLVKEKYIDNGRYARAFVEDKLRFSGWGRYKIKSALRAKQIDGDIIDEAIAEFDEPDASSDRLRQMLEEKMRRTTAKNNYDMKGKLLRFAASRGFSFDEAIGAIEAVMGDDE